MSNKVIRYVKIRVLKYGKINSVNPLHLIFKKSEAVLIEENNGNKLLTLVPTNESK